MPAQVLDTVIVILAPSDAYILVGNTDNKQMKQRSEYFKLQYMLWQK